MKTKSSALYDKYTLLGEHLANMFPNQVYSVAFTSGGGKVIRRDYLHQRAT